MPYKYLTSTAIFLCLMLLIPHCAPAEEPINKTANAGIFHFDGYHMKDADGRLQGYGIDLLGLISEYSHLNFSYSGYEKSWQEMLEMLKNGGIDILTSARRTPEREKLFAFSLPVGKNYTILSVRSDNPAIHPGDYSTYNGITIGILEGSSQNSKLEDFAKAKGFTYTPRLFRDVGELAQALQLGEVDAILSSNLRKTRNEKVLDVINADNFYVIARKEDQALIDEINYAIEQMNRNEGDWANDLFYRYYGRGPADSLEFTPREQAYIDAVARGEKKITASARGKYRPYAYIEDGQLKGILPDYFAQIMANSGLPYEFLPPKDDNDYRAMSEENGVTVILDRIRPQDVRESDVHRGFTTDPYLTTGMARVTRQNFQEPVRKAGIVGAKRLNLKNTGLEQAEIQHFTTAGEGIDALKSGAVDAVYMFPYAAQLFVNHDPSSDLYYTMMNDKGVGLRMYVPDTEDHELISILNKGIRNLPEGTLNQISSKYTSFSAGNLSVGEYLKANPWLTFFCAMALATGICLIIFLFFRSRWNRRMLAVSSRANRELAGQLSVVEALSRDYTNVLALDEDSGAVRMVKFRGDIHNDPIVDKPDEKAYASILAAYVRDRVHPADREYVSRALDLAAIKAKLDQQPQYTGAYRILANGETRYFQFTCVRLRETPGFDEAFILAGFRNIDEMIKKEQAQKAALREALAQARYANAAKTSFLNNMSHDIRTPMNAIIGFTDLATRQINNTAQVRGYLAKIMTSGRHLLSLINDVLDMSRIESGKVKIEEKDTSLPEVVHDLRTIVQADVKAKQLNFQIDTVNVTSETILCDRLRLNQVLLNILSNAMKYTPSGGSVSLRVIQHSAPRDGVAPYEFRIKDNGIGMGKEFLEHIFEPFEREQTSTISGIQGTGLGLAITKNIVGMMGGSITVESELGKGSEFIVRLDFKVVENADDEAELPQLAGKRALVVDDDLNSCTSVSRMLSTLGMKPDWTTLGREAIIRSQFAIEHKEAYRAYFIDWLMPDMNGLELARSLREIIAPEVPVIILTAYDWSDVEEEARAAGVTAFCSKPVFLSELRRILGDPESLHAKLEDGNRHCGNFSGKRILLAEDNEMNQEIAQMILEDAGFTLDIVENGADAVRRLDEQPAGTYDLVLMDVQMPVLNGYDATRRIRALADPAKASIPVVAMTANAFEEDRQEALKAGMNGYIAKPIDIGNLMHVLENILTHVEFAVLAK